MLSCAPGAIHTVVLTSFSIPLEGDAALLAEERLLIRVRLAVFHKRRLHFERFVTQLALVRTFITMGFHMTS